MLEGKTSKPLFLMVEREGLEPAGRMRRISNLLTLLEFLSPPLPSNPRIWHSIWHWNRHPCGQSELSRDSTARSAGSVSRRRRKLAVPGRPETRQSRLQVLPQQVDLEWLEHPGSFRGSELPTG
jgi:hypothetical protein